VSLDATDDFLKARVMNLPESVVAGTHNTEDGRLIYQYIYNMYVYALYSVLYSVYCTAL
jgi:hypothetical protein